MSEIIEQKLDRIAEDIVEIKVTLAKQHEQLAYHVKRTDLAEENIAMIRQDIEPIKKHVTQVKTLAKFVAWLLTGLGALILSLLKFIKH